MSDPIDQAVRILSESTNAIAFTGSGVSAESGIPTFRDPGGIWDRYDPSEIGTGGGLIATIMQDPSRFRPFLQETLDVFRQAAPNPAHTALAQLEAKGILRTVITQNIDGLHTEAGNSHVLEMHGNVYRHRCLTCGVRKMIDKEEVFSRVESMIAGLDLEDVDLGRLLSFLPECDCLGRMRPDVVMFGEAVQALPEAHTEAGNCDAMLIVGTSGVVYPAAYIPLRAAENENTRIIEINPREHPFSSIAHVSIAGSGGDVMAEIMKRLEGRIC